VRKQEFEHGHVIEVERAVERVVFLDAGAVLQQHAGAIDTFKRVVERFAVVRIGAGLEQQRRQFRIAIHPGSAVERRQQVILVRRVQRCGRQAMADRLVGIGAGRQQIARASAQALAKLRHLQQARMGHSEERRQV
jgi:hypothetical protein